MSTTYIAFRCKNREDQRRADKPTEECPGLLGGPSVDDVQAHDYRQGPLQFMVQCSMCRRWHEITIPSLIEIPVVSMLPKGKKLDVVAPEKYFGAVQFEKQEEQPQGVGA